MTGADNKAERRVAFGAKLRAAREAAGMSVVALGQTTRITIAFLEVLEAGDFDRLPGAVFGRGFVRSIARATNQDATALIQEFDALWEREPPKSVLKVEIKNKPTVQRGVGLREAISGASSLMRRVGWKVTVPAVAMLAMVYVVATQPGLRALVKKRFQTSGAAMVATPAKTIELTPKSDETPTEAPVVVAPATAPKDASPAVAATEATADSEGERDATEAAVTPKVASAGTGSQTLEFIVTEPVRVKLDVDGGETVTKELAPDTYRFTFSSKADVMVYDAAALKISYNGRPLGSLGNKGRVRRLSFDATTPAAEAPR